MATKRQQPRPLATPPDVSAPPLVAPPVRKPRGVPFAKGRDPRRGKGPVKGAPNAGPKPEWFKEKMRELVTREQTLAAFTEILTDQKHPAFVPAWKAAAEYGYGKPTAHVEVTGADGGPLTVTQTLVFGGKEIAF